MRLFLSVSVTNLNYGKSQLPTFSGETLLSITTCMRSPKSCCLRFSSLHTPHQPLLKGYHTHFSKKRKSEYDFLTSSKLGGKTFLSIETCRKEIFFFEKRETRKKKFYNQISFCCMLNTQWNALTSENT